MLGAAPEPEGCRTGENKQPPLEITREKPRPQVSTKKEDERACEERLRTEGSGRSGEAFPKALQRV